jgi:hypothetical protein
MLPFLSMCSIICSLDKEAPVRFHDQNVGLTESSIARLPLASVAWHTTQIRERSRENAVPEEFENGLAELWQPAKLL